MYKQPHICWLDQSSPASFPLAGVEGLCVWLALVPQDKFLEPCLNAGRCQSCLWILIPAVHHCVLDDRETLKASKQRQYLKIIRPIQKSEFIKCGIYVVYFAPLSCKPIGDISCYNCHE